MADALLEVRGVTKSFGGFMALDGVDFTVRHGERVGLIGPNGSGKSTLVNCITGTLRNEEGSIRFEGQDIRLQRDLDVGLDAGREDMPALWRQPLFDAQPQRRPV